MGQFWPGWVPVVLYAWVVESALHLLDLLLMWVHIGQTTSLLHQVPWDVVGVVVSEASVAVTVLMHMADSLEVDARHFFYYSQAVALVLNATAQWTPGWSILAYIFLASSGASVVPAANALWLALDREKTVLFVAAGITLLTLCHYFVDWNNVRHSELTDWEAMFHGASCVLACELCIVHISRRVGMCDPAMFSDSPLQLRVMAWCLGLDTCSSLQWSRWCRESCGAVKPAPLAGCWWTSPPGFPNHGFTFRGSRQSRDVDGAEIVIVPLSFPGQRCFDVTVSGAAWCYMLSLQPPLAFGFAVEDNYMTPKCVLIGPVRVSISSTPIFLQSEFFDESDSEPDPRRAPLSSLQPRGMPYVYMTSTRARRRLLRALLVTVGVIRYAGGYT